MSEVILRAEHVTRTLSGEVPVTLVKDASLEVRAGEFTVINGPSGSGKSSLLYLLGLLDRPSSGSVWLDGRDMTPLEDDARADMRLRHLGFVFQFHFLLPEFTALENVMLPMQRLGKKDAKGMRMRAGELLESVGLAQHLGKRPKQLSGGQQQRVAIARALANDPRLVLADEPTGNLDTASSANVQAILRELAHQSGRAVVAVSHDPGMAASADRRITIVDGKISPE